MPRERKSLVNRQSGIVNRESKQAILPACGALRFTIDDLRFTDVK